MASSRRHLQHGRTSRSEQSILRDDGGVRYGLASEGALSLLAHFSCVVRPFVVSVAFVHNSYFPPQRGIVAA